MPMNYRLLASANSAGSSSGGILQNIARYAMLLVSAVMGLVILLFTASAAIFVVLTLLFIALIAFLFFWARAKFFGKTLREKAFEDLQSKMRAQQSQFGFATSPDDFKADPGDDDTVIDAHKTPDGWSVDK